MRFSCALLCLLLHFSLQQDKVETTNLPLQQIGAGDLLGISALDAPELARNVRVSTDGTIQLPQLRTPLQVQGMLPGDVEKAIAHALQEQKQYLDPAISVLVVEYRSRPISVVGAVRKPLVFQAAGDVRLLEALARAEGLAPGAGGAIIVTRKSPDSLQQIPIKELISGTNRDLNILLRGNEEVRVPEVGRIVAWGNIRKPGIFPVQESGGSTVMTILAEAEGLQPFSAKVAYIIRKDAAGAKQEIPVQLNRMMARKSPDIPLQADDILYVPDNSGRRLTAMTLERIAGLGGTAASSLTVWR